MAEKSGIQMLEEILQRLDVMEQQFKVMDQNIKAIANSARMADLVNKAAGTSLDGWAKATKPGVPNIPDVKKKIEEIKAKATGFQNFKFEPSDASKLPGPPAAHRGQRPLPKNILVKGKLKIEKGDEAVPLAGVDVKIYDAKDKLVKSTKTNRAGHWMSHLPAGPYVALFEGEVDGKKLLPQNKNFEVPESLPEGQIELEII